MTLAELFAQAVAHHQAGQLDAAVASYRAALKIQSNNAKVLGNLGLALYGLHRVDEAVTAYRRAVRIEPGFAYAHNNLGMALRDLARLEESEASYRRALAIDPTFTDALNNLGNVLRDLGRLEEAETVLRRALVLSPSFASAHFNLGNILRDQGRLEEAETSYRHALAIKETVPEAHINLGTTLRDLGRWVEAEASYRRAIAIAPGFTAAHNSLGTLLRDLGRLDEAEASYRQAVAMQSDFADAHNNLGIVLRDVGRLAEAEASFRRAVEIDPDLAIAHNNLALVLLDRGRPMEALPISLRALHLKESWEIKDRFVSVVKRLRLTRSDDGVRAALVRALSEPWARPSELARVATDLVKATITTPHVTTAIATDPLLQALLVSAPVRDIGLERFLTRARLTLLGLADHMTTQIVAPSDFDCALAQQCFINEYVFARTEEEERLARGLRDALVEALATGAPIAASHLTAVACYFPLHSLPQSRRLLDRPWPGPTDALLVQQVREPAEELACRTEIPSLTVIDNEVSLRVQQQYEENPYPRWVKAPAAGKPKTIAAFLRETFPLVEVPLPDLGVKLEVLVAGCGTGQQSIDAARRFARARVLAIDLSLASLAYAKRKTRALGLDTIDYLQADIVKLGSLGRTFDVIESVGVLHHLADPFEGWRVLLSLLRPGGLMKIGLYSEVARRDVVRAQAFVATRKSGASAEDIRSWRQELISAGDGKDFEAVLHLADFFSTSECRDLLFHAQEHRMTLGGIEAFLAANGLRFLGFETDGAVMQAYREAFPDDRAATNLGHWQTFEEAHPNTFIGMYQFWVQKRAA